MLFDELGAGTDPTEGAALAMSILDHLHFRGIRTMATTHYSELKMYAITREGVENASVEFDVETLRPTYRLLIGVPGKSNAFEISKRLGLSDELIEGAARYLSQEDVRFEDIMGSIERNRTAAEQERQQTRALLAEAQELRGRHESQLAELNEQKANLIAKAREEARQVLRSARAEADHIIRELQLLAREEDEKKRNRAIEESRKRLRDTLGRMEDEIHRKKPSRYSSAKSPKNLQLGQTVYITTLDQKGQVLDAPSGWKCTHTSRHYEVNANISDLRLVKEETRKEAGTGRKVRPRSVSVSPELDLRAGMLKPWLRQSLPGQCLPGGA